MFVHRLLSRLSLCFIVSLYFYTISPQTICTKDFITVLFFETLLGKSEYPLVAIFRQAHKDDIVMFQCFKPSFVKCTLSWHVHCTRDYNKDILQSSGFLDLEKRYTSKNMNKIQKTKWGSLCVQVYASVFTLPTSTPHSRLVPSWLEYSKSVSLTG